MRFLWLPPLLVSLLVPVARAQTNPATLPARDSHQGIIVACDPYQDAERAKKTLGKENPLKAGIVPVDLYIQNNTHWPVAVTLDTIHMEVAVPGQEHQELDPQSPGDVATAILHPKPPNVHTPRVPLPLPGLRNPDKKWRKLRDSLQEASLQDGVVAPGATIHGFLYFDYDGQYNLLKDSRLLVPDLKFLGNGQAIMFFEVHLGPTPSSP